MARNLCSSKAIDIGTITIELYMLPSLGFFVASVICLYYILAFPIDPEKLNDDQAEQYLRS